MDELAWKAQTSSTTYNVLPSTYVRPWRLWCTPTLLVEEHSRYTSSTTVYATDISIPVTAPTSNTLHDDDIEAMASMAIFLVDHVGLWTHPTL